MNLKSCFHPSLGAERPLDLYFGHANNPAPGRLDLGLQPHRAGAAGEPRGRRALEHPGRVATREKPCERTESDSALESAPSRYFVASSSPSPNRIAALA